MDIPDLNDQLRAARLSLLKRQWQPVVQNIVAACNGDREAVDEVSPILSRLADHEDWRALTKVLNRIIGGERDPDALLHGLDATDTIIVGNVLTHLGVDLEGVAPGLILLEQIPESLASLIELSLVDLVATALAVGRPGVAPDERERVLGLTAALAADADAPEQLRALSGVLTDLLAGEQIDLAPLGTELRSLVTGSLAALLHPTGQVGDA